MGLPVEIVRSRNRRKTVQAVLAEGVIRVHVPATLTQDEVDQYVADLVPRLERRYRSEHIDLAVRAGRLARRYRLPVPRSIVWAENQRKRWGSCDTRTRDIRISARLAGFPPWVLDYVILHELAHLVVPDHSPAFARLVDRYPRAERARGYLMAKQDETTDRPPDADRDPLDGLTPDDVDPVDAPDFDDPLVDQDTLPGF